MLVALVLVTSGWPPALDLLTGELLKDRINATILPFMEQAVEATLGGDPNADGEPGGTSVSGATAVTGDPVISGLPFTVGAVLPPGFDGAPAVPTASAPEDEEPFDIDSPPTLTPKPTHPVLTIAPDPTGQVLRLTGSSGSKGATPTHHVRDGDLETDWHTTEDPAPPAAFVSVDTGAVGPITAIQWLFSRSGGVPGTVALAISDDGETWSTIATPGAAPAGTWQTLTVDATGRYVRFWFTNPEAAPVLGYVAEVKVWGVARRSTTTPVPAVEVEPTRTPAPTRTSVVTVLTPEVVTSATPTPQSTIETVATSSPTALVDVPMPTDTPATTATALPTETPVPTETPLIVESSDDTDEAEAGA
jgi:hypothetical protein